jgi:hypothetical protein
VRGYSHRNKKDAIRIRAVHAHARGQRSLAGGLMSTTRNVVGTIKKPDGTAWATADLRFVLSAYSQTADTQFPAWDREATTDDEGAFTVELWCNDEGDYASEYTVEFPSGDTKKFVLPAGVGDINLSALLLDYEGTTESAYLSLISYADTHLGSIDFSGTPAAGKIARASSGSGAAWSTATYPDTAPRGSLLLATALNVITALAIGAAGMVLKSDGTDAAWSALATSDIASGTFVDARIAESNVTQHQAALAIDCSQLTGVLANARVAQSNVTQHQAALSIAASQLSGTLPDARVAASNVTQHQAALSIAGSQLTGTVADARLSANVPLLNAAINAFTGGVTLTGVIGAGAGVFRADSSLEIRRQYSQNGPLFSLLDTTNPGVTGGECAIAYGGYDAGGTIHKQISISSKWANAAAGTGFAVLRFNATYAGGTQDDVAMRIFGNNGVSVFAGPGEDAAGDVPGQNCFAIGTGGAGKLSVGVAVPLYGFHVEQSAGVQVGSTNFYITSNTGTSSKGVLLGYDNTAQVGVVASRGFSSALAFWTGTASTFAEAMRINSAQNFGIGTATVNTWDTNHVGINLGGSGALMSHKTTAKSVYLLGNAYNDGNWKRRITGEATKYSSVAGVHLFSVVGSAAADSTIVTWIDGLQILNTGFVKAYDGTALADVVVGSSAKTTAGAPYVNDGYVVWKVGGVSINVMTTAG